MTNKDPSVHGTSKITEVKKKGALPPWAPWVIGALLILLLLLMFRSCSHRDAQTSTTTTTSTTTSAASPATPPVGVQQVTLPGGKVVALAPNTLNFQLQQYLGSSDPTPRTFTFNNLNFATNSAALPAEAHDTVNALSQILTAYPKAQVQLAGYADSTGSNPENTKLGAQRAAAVADALIAQGVAKDRLKTATGGSSNPVDTNATGQGRAENRRTELVVLTK